MTEEQVIEQLQNYKRLVARIQVLSTYSVGAGLTVSRLNEDDQLQELHRKLRGLPSYMYLNPHEQELETTAHAYLTKYPAGTRAQLQAVPIRGADPDDEKLLAELRGKIRKVIRARGWDWPEDVFDAVLERVAELNELQWQKERIDTVLAALEGYKPEHARLLRLRYVEGKTPTETAVELRVSERTLRRWEAAAKQEFLKLSD